MTVYIVVQFLIAIRELPVSENSPGHKNNSPISVNIKEVLVSIKKKGFDINGKQ